MWLPGGVPGGGGGGKGEGGGGEGGGGDEVWLAVVPIITSQDVSLGPCLAFELLNTKQCNKPRVMYVSIFGRKADQGRWSVQAEGEFFEDVVHSRAERGVTGVMEAGEAYLAVDWGLGAVVVLEACLEVEEDLHKQLGQP